MMKENVKKMNEMIIHQKRLGSCCINIDWKKKLIGKKLEFIIFMLNRYV